MWDPQSDPPGPNHAKFIAYNAEVSSYSSSHGTHIASIIAGNCPLDLAPTDRTGQAPHAKLVYSPVPQSGLEMLDTFELHASQGAFVHNNSWGDASTGSYSGLSHHADLFAYENEAHLLVFATVNSGDIKSPENAKNVLSVAASGGLGTPIPLTDFARGGIGPTLDGRLKPDIIAPGAGVLAATKRGDEETIPAMSLQARTGTSQAAAVVSGAATIVRQYYTEGFYPTGSSREDDAFVPSAALMKATLLNSTVDMSGIAGFPNGTEGWGRLHLSRSLFLSPGDRALFIDDRWNKEGLVTGSVVEHKIEVANAAEPFAVTLVWTDPPASAGALSVAINNLDLELVSPSGERYLGNVFGENAHSTPGGTSDSLNNVEQVRILQPETGEWTIQVLGTNIQQAEQGFALVASGFINSERASQPLAFDLPSDFILETASPIFTLTGPSSCTDVSIDLSLDQQLWTTIQALETEPGRYVAELPEIPCGTRIFLRAKAKSPAGQELHAPPSGSSIAWISRTVGHANSTPIFAESFESGISEGWTISGLWNATELCNDPNSGDGATIAYFGQPATCNFDTGYRVSGELASPDIQLPAIGSGERLELTYRSRLDAEASQNVDIAELSINGVLLDRPLTSGTEWVERTFDITSHAGSNVRLNWFFDSIDAVNNQ
ncbi:MAG: S8 family serine peptidase, partial [Planctomycetota bacterium]